MCAGSLLKGTGSHPPRRGKTFMEGGGGGRYKIYNRICPVLWWLLIFINIHITAHIVYNINFATLTLSFLSKCYIILILFLILI